MDAKLMSRFEEKFERGDGCWRWLATRNNKGYGKITVTTGEKRYAHRVAYELYVAPIPNGMQVLHRCDNPACVNPNHLFLGTHIDNMRDMAAKLRRSRLSRDDVIKIRGSSVALLASIAAECGISIGHARNVKSGFRCARGGL